MKRTVSESSSKLAPGARDSVRACAMAPSLLQKQFFQILLLRPCVEKRKCADTWNLFVNKRKCFARQKERAVWTRQFQSCSLLEHQTPHDETENGHIKKKLQNTAQTTGRRKKTRSSRVVGNARHHVLQPRGDGCCKIAPR